MSAEGIERNLGVVAAHDSASTPGAHALLGLELPTALAPGTLVTATVPIPTLSGVAETVDLDVVVQSCRPHGSSWVIGTRIVDSDDAAARRVVEYCYVVCQGQRLRGGTQVALPTPAVAGVVPADLALPVGAEAA